MTLLDHLSELRVRLVRCLIALTVGFFACYGFAEELFNYLMIPLTRALPSGAKLIYTALPEAFFVYMQVALVAGAFLASPYLFYQIWAFIAPGLYDEEKRHIIPIAGASALFFVAGAAFCYFQVFPYAFEFFVGFATDTIAPMPKLDEYLGFTLKMLLAFGLIFEMPLFAFFLSRLGLVTAQWMRKTRKYAILAIFIVAAILTPPDVFSQLMMAAPMLVLYEISILVAAVFGKKKPGADEEDEEDEGAAEEEDGDAEKPGPDKVVQGD
ncbi:twin-arginine translocase subunit TatC [Nitratidesulfovibrio sp. 1201_IL3209]|uniref:twin-arginine translocase subunit TatC n=1 Tax=Nitratidesulfovibrio sp. 1201_IL3209 TaxID=3084053 RepID=UPI003FA5B129